MKILLLPGLTNTLAVWHTALADDAAINPGYLPLLSTEERTRAETLSNPLLKSRHIEVRGRLRTVLGSILQQNPAHIRIVRTAQGKPYLPDYPQLAFNISHTTNQLVIAVAQNCQLGADIELCRPRANLAALVAKCFADEEAAYWHSLPEPQKTATFYSFWTKKEAFVKATGLGIALGLKQCVVDPQQPDRFLRLPEGYGAVADWRIVGLDETMLDAGLCGAVVLDKKSVEIQTFPGELTFPAMTASYKMA